MKTLVDNIYYYQDELGSTSHIADGIGALIESYQYDVYGKPQVYDSSGTYRPYATPQAQDLFTGQRWHSELGLYDDRNRFMSPDLGRFLQPDPIGFKGDASNLYRYCGNDWANRTDPMGLTEAQPIPKPDLPEQLKEKAKIGGDRDRGNLAEYAMLNMGRIKLNWRDTGDNNIRQSYVLSDQGIPLPAKTYSSVSVTGTPDEHGGLKELHVEYKIDVKYATTAGPNTQKFTWRREIDHERELRGNEAQLRAMAREIGNRYSKEAQRAVNEVNNALQAALTRLKRESHDQHDQMYVPGHDDHVTYHSYDW